MRYLDPKGGLKLKKKDLKAESNHVPWFNQTHVKLKDKQNIVFGINFGQLESPNSELWGAPGPGGVTLGIWAWEVNNLL